MKALPIYLLIVSFFISFAVIAQQQGPQYPISQLNFMEEKLAAESGYKYTYRYMSDKELNLPYSHDECLSTIKKLYQDFASGDIPAIKMVMHDNIEWNEAEGFPYADGNPYIGFDAVIDGVFSRISNEWEYWKLEDLTFEEMGTEKVFVTGRYHAKYKRNGAIIKLQMAHIWTFNENKIIKFQQYADTQGIATAMVR